MSKNLINILRSKLFSRSLPFYRRKDSSDEEQIRKSSKKLKNPEEGGEEQVRAGDEGAEGEGAEGDEGEFDYTKRISRRDRKRIRITNIFDPENTGEKPVHEWLDAKRIKSLGNLYEQFRNTHRFTMKIDSKDKKTLGKKILELTEIQVNYFFVKN